MFKMYKVKCEKSSGVCRGCLSSDRRLFPLLHYELFTKLLNHNLKDTDKAVVLLCWECEALIRRIHRFQLQAQKADQMLSESFGSFLVKKSLSKLEISHKQDYDTIIEETYATYDKLDSYENDDKEKKSELNKNEENDSHEAGHFEEDYFDSKVSSDEENTRNPENTIIETINRKFMKKGKNKDNTIEFIAASLVTNRKSARINALQKKNYFKITKRKKRFSNNKVDTTQVNIKIKNEMELDIDIPKSITENSNENETNEQLSVEQENNIMDINTDAITELDEKIESSNSDSDSIESDPDFCVSKEKPKQKKSETDKPKWHGKRKSDRLKKEIVKYHNDQFDEYFSKVEVADGMLEELLKSEPRYTTEQRPVGCEYCGRTFEMPKHMRHHQNQRHKQIRKAMSIKDPTSHLYYRYSMYRCSLCESVVRIEHTDAHMKYKHRIKHTCSECDAVFWDPAAAYEHADAHKNHSEFVCKFCNAVKRRRKFLEAHVRKYHTPMICDDCGHESAMRKHFLRHREDAHPASSPELRYCVQCDAQYRSVAAYEHHLKTTAAHRGPAGAFPCPECPAVLKSKESVELHMDYHRGETRFQCPHCGKYFARKCGLQKHIRYLHLKVPKPKDKICPYCGRGFSQNRSLKFHIRTHTNEKPHTCNLCPAAFNQPWPLKKHLATVHKQHTGYGVKI